ncbi:hypothetical protein DPMN_143545 [Dreissena polymorpha]|uniref:Uncharacterized protein n=1 Tax=Dreissena polymorpha TaxID=45954 RepID=A0A9D4GD16_DREPO|nr:hypothetical protein DPMN_143545 [Dreissena polymorpha]
MSHNVSVYDMMINRIKSGAVPGFPVSGGGILKDLLGSSGPLGSLVGAGQCPARASRVAKAPGSSTL